MLRAEGWLAGEQQGKAKLGIVAQAKQSLINMR
jgi:hypothetical protein